MRRFTPVLASLLLACTLGAAPPAAPDKGIGSVHMDISCGADASARFDRGLALLHNFWYERALTEFQAVIAKHPDCAIAYWGAAMTYNHPLWAPPTGTDVKDALAVLARAKGAATRNDREAKYLAAVVTLFGDGNPAKKDARDVAYRDAMRAILSAYPDDETKLFTSLAIQSVRGLTDAGRTEAADLAEAVHQHQPNHPGSLHYLIHAYDADTLAERGLPAARAYAASAPAVPHALHMPSHIFLRLGLWDEARDSNLASWKASEDAVRAAGEPQSARQFHNLQFGQYAAVQLGRYAEAKQQAMIALDQYDDNLRRIARGGLSSDEVDDLRYLDFDAVGMAGAYMLSSGDYSLAARLPASPSSPVVAALVQHLQAMAAIARNDADAMTASETAARTQLASLPTRGMVALVAPVAANETLAAIAHARHDDAAAFRAMDAAVAAEDAQSRHIQPTWPPVPAHELYGRMLMDAGKYDAAAAQFRTALKLFPNRALATLGAARATRAAGDRTAAARYAAAFTAMWSKADAGRPELTEAIALR
ncbi:MAG: tetratricopeptide repeat protein [Candidatus Eremiobacteraeota bacterium]|nr:tetratricopeptide repeat protein [Candidatus Eremiobacteraeota bacterium]